MGASAPHFRDVDEAARAWIHCPYPQPRAHDRRFSFTVGDWRPRPSPFHLRWVSSPRGWPVLGLQLEPLSRGLARPGHLGTLQGQDED